MARVELLVLALALAFNVTPVRAQEAFGELPIKYIGNSFSAKFHRPSCIFAYVMNKRHRLYFHYRADAINDGCTPCNWCLPKHWRQVKSMILKPVPVPTPVPTPEPTNEPTNDGNSTD